MSQRAALILGVTILAVICASAGEAVVGDRDLQSNPEPQSTPEPQSKKESAPKKKAEPTSTMTGCVDQQDGNYVLIDERNRNPIADLIAEGFPTEGFAKHVGQKVTVRGTSNPGGTRPAMKVRTIETVSETCSPEQGKV